MTEAKPILSNGRDEKALALYEAIKHGDETHREWLKEALLNWFAGKPVPPPRSATPAPSPVVGEGWSAAGKLFVASQFLADRVGRDTCSIPAITVVDLLWDFTNYLSISPPRPTEDLGGPQAPPAWQKLATAPLDTPVLFWWNGRAITGRRVKPFTYAPEAFIASRVTEDGKPSHWAPLTPPSSEGEARSGSTILPNELDSLMSAQRELVIEECARVADEMRRPYECDAYDAGCDYTAEGIAACIRSLSTTTKGEK